MRGRDIVINALIGILLVSAFLLPQIQTMDLAPFL
jgi:hypothetical protein